MVWILYLKTTSFSGIICAWVPSGATYGTYIPERVSPCCWLSLLAHDGIMQTLIVSKLSSSIQSYVYCFLCVIYYKTTVATIYYIQ